MEIIYRTDITPDTDQIIDVYNSSGINPKNSQTVGKNEEKWV